MQKAIDFGHRFAFKWRFNNQNQYLFTLKGQSI